jgi:hypothetical protein
VQFTLIHFSNSLLGGGAGGESDKPKASGALSSTFHWEKDIGDFSKVSKFLAK